MTRVKIRYHIKSQIYSFTQDEIVLPKLMLQILCSVLSLPRTSKPTYLDLNLFMLEGKVLPFFYITVGDMKQVIHLKYGEVS